MLINANFALKSCSGALRIAVGSGTQNSAFRKWKFCAQEIEIPCSKKKILHSEKVENFPNAMERVSFLCQIEQFCTIPCCHAQDKIPC